MKISEFVSLLKTTKDTVRHYEELNLIKPSWLHNRREYTDKDILNFQVILEMKSMGLSLQDIQLLFDLKKTYSCGDRELLNQVIEQLSSHLEKLQDEERQIRKRVSMLEDEIKTIKEHIK